MIKVGDALPAATLMEYSEVEGNGCSIGPNPVDVVQASAGKTIALFALPGAFTPTCSAKHVPGYVAHFDDLKKAGVDEIWCVSVNDAFVMGAWARDQHTNGKVRQVQLVLGQILQARQMERFKHHKLLIHGINALLFVLHQEAHLFLHQFKC
jgi:peroxiredoxin